MTKEQIKQNFGRVWPTHVANLVDHLVACRKVLGSLDTLLVLAMIAERNISPRNTDPETSFDDFRCDAGRRPEPINIESMADYSGISRETIRRRVKALTDRGWLERTGSSYAISAKCHDELMPLREHGVQYLARLSEVLLQLDRKP